jgi:glycosyltransferase involved in cell wall biosynthesis
MRRVQLAARRLVQRPDVALVHRPRRGPYGGSNQFLVALAGELGRRGLRVSWSAVDRRTRACLIHSYLVDAPALRRMLHAGCRVVHRIDGPITLYRGHDDGSDRRIEEINRELADATILQSGYSAEAHRRLGLELRDPVVIPNAVDPALFHPGERRPLGRRVRLIATSWSDNPNKGAATYRWLAEYLDPERYELTFAGRTPVPLPGARVVPPLDSRRLGELLREHDVYVAASLHESCSNALLEGLASGLPVLYARSGGHPELVGEAGFPFDRAEELPELLERLVVEYSDRRERISVPTLSQVADRYLEVMGMR